MARSIHLRRRWWTLASLVGIGLFSAHVWWAGRLGRAVDRIVAAQNAQLSTSSPERIPDAWVPDLTSEMVRDDTRIESFRISVQSRLPSRLIPPSIRYPGAFLRRDRALATLSSGRDPGEILRALESAFPQASADAAQWLLSAFDAISTPDDSGRRSLFLTASRNPDPQVRLAAVALVAGKLNTGRNGDRSDGPAWDRLRELLDDQVSVVREAAARALAEAGGR